MNIFGRKGINQLEETNAYNICNDWGWYVDIENNKIINSYSYNDIQFHRRGKFLQTIYEHDDKYDDDDDDDDNDEHLMLSISRCYKIGSTTIATFVLTYIAWVFI